MYDRFLQNRERSFFTERRKRKQKTTLRSMTAFNKEPNDGYHKGDPKENKSTLHKNI